MFCSCTENHGNIEIDFPETISYEGQWIRGIEYGHNYSDIITEVFVKEYPYLDGYYGYYLDEDLYLDSDWRTFEVCDFNINIPAVDIGVDERLLLYFRYEDEVYQRAKGYLMENLDLSNTPIEEYNGYIFYDNFTSDKYMYEFNRFVYNDNNNAIILLGLYYDYSNEFYADDYELGDFLNMFYGGWYDFSE